MSVSLDEVAKRAKVSTATVSRVLNNINVVKDSTRSRVMRAVRDLNYQPNLNARTLAGGKSHTIGMIVSNLENPYFFDIYRALEAEAHANGYEVVIAHTGYQPDQLNRSVRVMIGRRVAGLAVMVSEMDPALIQLLSENKIHAVFSDVGAPGKLLTNIRVNYRRGIERIVEHVCSLGHRSLAFVGHHATLGPISERERGFVETVAKLTPPVKWQVVLDQDGLSGGYRAAKQLLGSGERPTAIVCVNDFMAAGVLRAVREAGLTVPRDISVTGFDNIEMAEYCVPQLTTAHIARDRVGQLAFQALTASDEDAEAEGREYIIDAELVIRESTGPVPR